jgi:choline dehydrogenase-like flavoprotein
MLVDQSKCGRGYTASAKWNARTFLHEALARGATLVSGATVHKVLLSGKRCIGADYSLRTGRKRSERRRAYADRVVLAAGSLESPVILQNSGIRSIAEAGFYSHPSSAMFGVINDLKAKNNFVASMGADLEHDIALGDANASSTWYRMIMLGSRRYRRAFMYSRSVGVAVVVRDRLGGRIDAGGRFHKPFSAEEAAKLKKGEQAAKAIIENAGAKDVFALAPMAAHVGGTIRIREHVNAELETEYDALHVCDGSVVPDSFRLPPTLTLVCLGKYLANVLSRS